MILKLLRWLELVTKSNFLSVNGVGKYRKNTQETAQTHKLFTSIVLHLYWTAFIYGSYIYGLLRDSLLSIILWVWWNRYSTLKSRMRFCAILLFHEMHSNAAVDFNAIAIKGVVLNPKYHLLCDTVRMFNRRNSFTILKQRTNKHKRDFRFCISTKKTFVPFF